MMMMMTMTKMMMMMTMICFLALWCKHKLGQTSASTAECRRPREIEVEDELAEHSRPAQTPCADPLADPCRPLVFQPDLALIAIGLIGLFS